jgi:ribosome modulation factor
MSERPDYVQEGIDAYAQGVSRVLCPYPPGTAAEQEWLKGWDEAKAIHDRIVTDDY